MKAIGGDQKDDQHFSYLRLGFSLPIFCGVFSIYIDLMGM